MENTTTPCADDTSARAATRLDLIARGGVAFQRVYLTGPRRGPELALARKAVRP